MKTLKLEVGKTYRNRKGEEVKIVEKDGGMGAYPCKGSNGERYTENGGFAYTTETPDDLIEEVGSTRHTFDIPDGVKKITVSQVGNKIVIEMVPDTKEPKPGDVMINKDRSVYIFKGVVDDYNHEHFAWLGISGRLAINTNTMCNPGRPATPEEAQPLWDALKKAGKRWNPETMQVEEIPEFDRIRELMEVIERYLKYREE